MAAQSGIAPTQDLLDTWATALQDPHTRLVKIAIQDEQLVPAGTFPSTTSHPADDPDAAFERDFALFDRADIVEDKVPAYFAYRLTPPPSSTFAFLSYVPDHAPVRAKMLYASTRNTLVRALGDARFTESVFATDKSDLTHTSYLSHVAHASAAAPLTAREQEMRDVRAAEAAEARAGPGAGAEARGEGRSVLFGAARGEGEGVREGEEGEGEGEGEEKLRGVLPWSDEAKAAVRALGDEGAADGALVQLEIDVPTETVVLSPSQPSSLSALPPASPAYLVTRHAAHGVVVVYSCPTASPVRHRLLYSSAVVPLCRVAAGRWAGVRVGKKLETDDPSEVTPAWLDAELGPAPPTSSTSTSSSAASAGASGTATPVPTPQQQEDDKPKFARPARPGRRR